MRTLGLGIVGGFGIGLAAATVLNAQIEIRQQAPTDRAADFPLAEIEAIIKDMDAIGRPTTRLLEGGSYNVNIRRISDTETALMHPQTTDVYVVIEGSGTLITGGQILDAQGQPVEGQRGASIRGGTARTVSAGDLVFIPAGVPHGFRETEGITWFNIRFDTK